LSASLPLQEERYWPVQTRKIAFRNPWESQGISIPVRPVREGTAMNYLGGRQKDLLA
jgi:hypothetical protein